MPIKIHLKKHIRLAIQKTLIWRKYLIRKYIRYANIWKGLLINMH